MPNGVPGIRFDEQVVLVTGAAGGLGRAHALLFASRGAAVVVNDVGSALDGTGADASRAGSVVDEIEALGGRALASSHDITDPELAQDLVGSAIDAFGGLHAFVHSAGILRDRTVSNLTPDDVRRVLDVHLVGAFNVCRAAMPAFAERSYGRIVLTTSGAGLYGHFGQANYAAAKMGLVGLARVLAVEGAKRGVLANAVSPGAATRMSAGLLGRLEEHLDPAHVAPLVAYLCSSTCAESGQVFEAAGGMFRRVVVGATRGWFAGVGGPVRPEDVAGHWAEITDETGLVVPRDAMEANRTLLGPLAEATRR